MKKYVVGFAFNDNHVLLIEKKRPSWQKGLLNGLGGHIERDETPIDAMVREFQEECGIATKEQDWEQYAEMKGEDWICYCFRSRNVFDLAPAAKTTDEVPKIINAYTLENYPTISNIPALVGLAMDNNLPNNVMLDYSTNNLKKQKSNDVGDVEKAAESIFNIDVVKEIIFEFIDGKITIGKLTENLNNKVKLKNMEAGHTTHISEFLQSIDLITDYAISDSEKLKMIESEVKKEYARIGRPENTIAEGMEKAAQYYAVNTFGGHQAFSDFKAGAEWQSKQQPIDIEKEDEDLIWDNFLDSILYATNLTERVIELKKQFSISRKQ